MLQDQNGNGKRRLLQDVTVDPQVRHLSCAELCTLHATHTRARSRALCTTGLLSRLA